MMRRFYMSEDVREVLAIITLLKKPVVIPAITAAISLYFFVAGIIILFGE